MSKNIDLTRWNRISLSRFRYIDGNAITYLETIRSALTENFKQWQELNVGQAEQVSGQETREQLAELLRRREARMMAQYSQESREYAWELARSLARAIHVLTEHIDTYANEGFLGTATQWDNVRRLVEMMGYKPASPASASTRLVLSAKDGQMGTVHGGFQVKYKPQQGGDAVIFETLTDLEIDAVLNELRLSGWDRSVERFDPGDCGVNGLSSTWLMDNDLELSVGAPALLVQEISHAQNISISTLKGLVTGGKLPGIDIPGNPGGGIIAGGGISVSPDKTSGAKSTVPALSESKPTEQAFPVLVNRVNTDDGRLCIDQLPATPPVWIKGRTRLLLSPGDIYKPHLNGPTVLKMDRLHGLSASEVVAWQNDGVWVYDIVEEVDGKLLRLAGQPPVPPVALYKALLIRPLFYEDKGKVEFRISKDTALVIQRTASGSLNRIETIEAVYTDKNGDSKTDSINDVPADQVIDYLVPTGVTAPQIYILGPTVPLVGNIISTGTIEYIFDGDPGDLQSGQWVLGESETSHSTRLLYALRIATLEVREDSFLLGFESEQALQVAGIPTGKQSLLKGLRRVESCLDQAAFTNIKLGELISHAVGDMPVSDIQGVGTEGKSFSFTDTLADFGIKTIAELASADPGLDINRISPAKLREIISHAEQVMDFEYDVESVTDLLDTGLMEITERLSDGDAGKEPAGVQAPLLEDAPRGLMRLYGPFENVLRPQGYNRDTRSLPRMDKLHLDINITSLPETFKVGKTVLIEQETAAVQHVAVINEINRLGNTITISPALPPAAGFTIGNTIIRCNVVNAGHGETKPRKVLGSGDATRQYQSFILAVEQVSFVADPAFPSGVRADIDIQVGNRTWQQVPSLTDSRPTDAHYTVSMTEQGYLKFSFGDGRRGRRLPTGNNNVSVTYRVGTGLRGNLEEKSLVKPLKPHPLVASVRQPMRSTGGNDMENVRSLRENAPATTLTVGRAVSLTDFAHLAASHSSVWQAHSFLATKEYSRKEKIKVVIVPARGGAMDEILRTTLRKFLKSNTVAGIEFDLVDYQHITFDVDINIYMNEQEYDPELVKANVRDSLNSAFELRKRKLGKDVYLSEVYHVVENVEGVEYSSIRFLGDGNEKLRRIEASKDNFHNNEIVVLLGEQSIVKHSPAEETGSIENMPGTMGQTG